VEVLGEKCGGSAENGVATSQADNPMVTAPGFRLRERRPVGAPGEGNRRTDFEKRLPKKPFINLSSTAALIRHLFSLNAVIAAIEINKIHIDPFSPEQEVGELDDARSKRN
jgi:hypothetical protein